MNKKAFRIAFPLLITLTILIALLSLLIGSADINPVHAILNKDSTDHIILFSVRLPRMLAAMLAGLALSVSGLLLQSATGNDLASPNIIGMNSGSGFAVLLFLSFFPELFDVLPFAAFIGGLVASSLVFIISASVSRMNSSGSLILGGIAVNALFNAFISTLSSLDPDVLSTYSAFSIGGFSSVQASMLYVPGIIIIASSVAAFFMTERMDVIRLGDEIASSMGYRPLSIRVSLVAIAALASSSAVTFAGLLGFVGLVTPHIARFISGGESRKTLLLTVVIGPLLVMLSDLLARTVIMPGELPAGVFMAIIGVPFFLFLLIRRLCFCKRPCASEWDLSCHGRWEDICASRREWQRQVDIHTCTHFIFPRLFRFYRFRWKGIEDIQAEREGEAPFASSSDAPSFRPFRLIFPFDVSRWEERTFKARPWLSS